MSRPAAAAADWRLAFTTWRGGAAVVVSAVVAMAAYAVWLPWHATKHTDPVTQTQTGPYTESQVLAVIIVVGLVALVGGWLRLVLPTACGAAIGVTVMFSADAATQTTTGANLWPVGAVMLVVAAWVGVFVVAYLTQATRNGVTTLRRRD